MINWLIGGGCATKCSAALVACGSIAVSTIVAFMIAFRNRHTACRCSVCRTNRFSIISGLGYRSADFRADFGLGMDRLSGIYACFITFVGLLIHIFATGYMKGDKGFYRFFAYLNLFMFSMLTLVLADNFLLMFVGWEGVGLCSYLLIGYYIKKTKLARLRRKRSS